jgi:HEPN domain-containing protein
MKRTTRIWAKKAEDDFRGAVNLHVGSEPLHDLVCFHCQQSAEKYLKAMMESLNLTVPRIHDLIELQRRLLPTYPKLARLTRALNTLTRFAVEPVYPILLTTKRQAASALRRADEIRTAYRTLLGLQVKPPGKKA